ncbi:glycerophosphodiester phosphodiesterase family protein [Fulvivirgaceae bacterium PWU4]|uniref:Glycerophosphodiester phosphodiesterase family protein n=1 Tax=Chryseosolibacter histidini TaxID=2782349 RepID=A0AAP2DR90_9BACT|nr:glycerophosphodiester phosphodiesterase family protein [Chryseosolibacter histidini]MBT1698864.1 glycerophosphodiester phosphodiesterase family protein [Chryseosolibacter histidini]
MKLTNYNATTFLLVLCTFLPAIDFAQDAAEKIVYRFPEISAHRGASRSAPENTLASFSKAIGLGAGFLEVDVRTTRDEAQVCLHDGSLKRTTGVEKKITEVSVKDLRALSAGSWFGKEFAGEKIPLLEDLCKLVSAANKDRSRHIKLYVDCKDIDASKVVRILRDHGVLDSAVFYGNLTTLARIREHASTARLMPAYPGVADARSVIRQLKPYAFDVSPSELDDAVVRFCHDNRIKVFTDLLDEYDTPQQYARAIRLGVDVIQTDDIIAVQEEINKQKGSQIK